MPENVCSAGYFTPYAARSLESRIEKSLCFPVYDIGFSGALYYFQAYALPCLSCLNILVLNLHRFDDLLEVRRRSLSDYCVTDFQWGLQFDHGDAYFREEMSYATDFNNIFAQ